MERFVRLVVAGGVVFVASLWTVEFASPGSLAWLAAAATAVVGGASALAGIWLELDVGS